MSKLLVAPLEALTDPRLSDPERRVLLALFSFRGRDTNTVFPSLGVLGERANIKDHTRVSKITTALAAKGWLTKKKRGFTGANQYSLTVPEDFSDQSDVPTCGLMDEGCVSTNKSEKVYIVTDGTAFKIGITTMPMTKRLASLQTSSPARLSVVCCAEVSHAKQTEADFAEKYVEKRLSGEWYELTISEVVELVGRIEELVVGRFYSNLDLLSNLAQGAKLARGANSNLDYSTNSNLASAAKYKEQTIEQTIEEDEATPPKVMAAYNELLGHKLPRARGLSDKRRKYISARMAEDSKRKLLSWWQKYFLVVSASDFLLGHGPPKWDTGKPWNGCDLEWLVKPDNMLKVLEGKYDNRK